VAGEVGEAEGMGVGVGEGEGAALWDTGGVAGGGIV
jgi:hypothetical protein